MGIIWDITRGVKSAYNAVKWIFTQQPTTVTPEKTLNEEINTPVKAPTIQVGSFANTLNNQINTGQIPTAVQNMPILNKNNAATLSAPTTETQRRANIWASNNVENRLSTAEQIQEEADADKGFSMPDFIWFGEKLIGSAVNFWTRLAAQKRYNNEVEANSQSVLLSYNPTTNIATKLVPQDEGAFIERLNILQNDYEAASTPEEQDAVLQSFYNDVKDGFKAKAVQLKWWYDWLKKYSSDTLSAVSNNNIKAWNYPASEEEIWAYVDTISNNEDIARTAYEKYKDDMNVGLDEVDLTETETSNEVTQRFMDIAKKWTLDKINTNLASKERWEAIRNVEEVAKDQIDRLLATDMYLKKLRDEAIQTPELQRTSWQMSIIHNYDVTWKQMMDKLANNINDYLLLQLDEWVNESGEIEDALWKFEWGRELNDILRDWLDEISGIEISWLETFGKVSAIDIMRRFANEAAYEYRQWKLAQDDAWIKSAWNTLEHSLEPVWEQRSEAWQALWRLSVKTINTVSSAFEWRRGWNSPTSAYLDADFSVGKLIETDDSPNKRTVKKYALQFGEYVPEGIGAVAPDIALTFATAWWSAPSLLRSVWAISKLRNFTRINNLIKEGKQAGRLIDAWLRGIEKVSALWKELWNINSRYKRVINIADRALSQFAVWQSMDAKLSAFDTEPYSDTSFWLSMWGSLLWDILPEAKDIWGIMRTWAKWWKALTKWTWVWDLVDFINQSDENALLIAKQMWKNTANFSEQDLKNYVRSYAEITDAAKRVYNELTAEWKVAANSWTKELMYNYVKQAYWANSRIWKAVRAIVENWATNPADIIKYVWNVPWTVSIWPYQSVIKLKHWTLAWVEAKNWWRYDVALDNIDWWFGSKVLNGFTFKDIQDISKINGYDDVLKNKDKYFRKVVEKTKNGWTRTRRVLTEDGLDKFGLEAKSLSLDSLWIEISEAENVREIFKEKMKNLSNMKLSEDTINALADGGGYSEVVSKVENILC